MGLEWVRTDLIDRALRTQERRNIRKKGSSFTQATMENMLSRSGFFLEVGDKVCLMREGWRDYIKSIE